MTTSILEINARAHRVEITDDELIVSLVDGRVLCVPITWFPRLLDASSADRRQWELLGEGEGIHWPQLDEDVSVAGLLRGVRGRGPSSTPS